MKLALIGVAIVAGTAATAADGCRSVARAEVLSVDYVGEAPIPDELLGDDVIDMREMSSVFRVRLRMEPAVVGVDGPREVEVNLISTHPEYISRRGRIVLIYDLRAGRVEPVDWNAISEEHGETVCMAQWAAEEYGVEQFGRTTEDGADTCFDRER